MKGMRHYVLKSWNHLLPHRGKFKNLNDIAQLLAAYDIVALQEVDAGSFRSLFVNQVEYLAQRAGFAHWACQTTRNLGHIARHSKGTLSQLPILESHELGLPSKVPGRGIQIFKMDYYGTPIYVCNVHLSLSRKTQLKQLDFLVERLSEYEHVIIMGDFNVDLDRIWRQSALVRTQFQLVNEQLPTFPSWKPSKNFDAILVSHTFEVKSVEILPVQYSDHLPIAATVCLKTDKDKA